MLWIVVGGIAGLLADAVVRRISVGLVGAIVVGILGAFIGAVVLLVLLRAIRRWSPIQNSVMGLPNGKNITSNALYRRYRVYGRLFVINESQFEERIDPDSQCWQQKATNNDESLYYLI